ncbi:hypothetical protein ACQSNA_001486 [Vibrio metschnikovii]
MHKRWLVCLTPLVLTACMSASGLSTSGQSAVNANNQAFDQELVLQKTQNYSALIELYKQQLQQSEQRTTRLKLAQAYLDYQDPESALFTLQPLINLASSHDQEFYLQGMALYRLNRLTEAQQALNLAHQHDSRNAQTINMLGILYAQSSDLEQARLWFNRARELMYDDTAIKNNLALIDMLEEDYQAAADRLLPIYLNGQADERVIANLAIIMAKLGRVDYLHAFYAQDLNTQQINQLYSKLQRLNLHNNHALELPTEPDQLAPALLLSEALVEESYP